MLELQREDAFRWLWGITWLNIGGGVLVWIINIFRQFGAEGDLNRSRRDRTRSESENVDILVSAQFWQEISATWIGFGILVLVVTLAAVAIAGKQRDA